MDYLEVCCLMFPVNRSVAEFQSDCSVVRERALCNFLNGLGDHCVDTCSVGSEWSPFSLFSVLLPFWALVGQLLRGVSRLCPQGRAAVCSAFASSCEVLLCGAYILQIVMSSGCTDSFCHFVYVPLTPGSSLSSEVYFGDNSHASFLFD